MRQNDQRSRPEAGGEAAPGWSAVLRALREAAGITQAAWAARLGYGRRTVQRWEMGDLTPDAAAAEALIKLCSEQRLWRRYGSGPLAGILVTDDWLRSVCQTRVWEAGVLQTSAASRRIQRRAHQHPYGPRSPASWGVSASGAMFATC
jgi:transcriptional regulator with XRE-family HTH domain